MGWVRAKDEEIYVVMETGARGLRGKGKGGEGAVKHYGRDNYPSGSFERS